MKICKCGRSFSIATNARCLNCIVAAGLRNWTPPTEEIDYGEVSPDKPRQVASFWLTPQKETTNGKS